MRPTTTTDPPPLDPAFLQQTLANTFDALPLLPGQTPEQLLAQRHAARMVFADMDPRTPEQAIDAARVIAGHYGLMECLRLAHAPDTPPSVALRWVGKALALSRMMSGTQRKLRAQKAAPPAVPAPARPAPGGPPEAVARVATLAPPAPSAVLRATEGPPRDKPPGPGGPAARATAPDPAPRPAADHGAARVPQAAAPAAPGRGPAEPSGGAAAQPVAVPVAEAASGVAPAVPAPALNRFQRRAMKARARQAGARAHVR